MTDHADLPALARFAADRFSGVHKIGQGRNATVFQAWDRHLERIVAFKTGRDRSLLAALGSGPFEQLTSSDQLLVVEDLEVQAAIHERYSLLREGRLLAQIEHPNVLSVLDIGVLDTGEVAVVMPCVTGGTLDGYVFTEPWEEVLDIAVALGRGLEAIHRAGLIHRDFKPANVLLGSDGRPRIADLGFTCDPNDSDAMADWAGTTRYMAVEVINQRMRDLRDDIYAYCMVVYEMFYGYAPFVDGDARSAGKVRAGKRQAGMSAAVHEILVRGLAPDPDDRWPDMGSVLEAMEQTRQPQARRRWPWIAAGFAAAVAFGLVAVPAAQADACEEVSEEVGAIFDNEIQAELRGAYGTSNVGAAMKRYATGWVQVRARECEAAKLADRSTDASPCAASTKARFDATLQVFRVPHLRAGLSWGRVIAMLPDPEHCIDHPEDATWGYGGLLELTQLDVDLDVAVTTGDLEFAKDRLRRLAELASGENYRHGVARAAYWTGEIRRREGDLDGAARSAQRAYETSIELGNQTFEAECLLSLTAIAAASGELDKVEWYGGVARPAFSAHAPELLPELLQVHGLALLDGPDDVRARGLELLREAVELREDESAWTREPLSVAYESYARGLLAVELPGAALEYLERSEGLHRAEFGLGTWRVHDLLQLKFEARLEAQELTTATSAWWALLMLSVNAGDWEQHTEDAFWIAEQYEQAAHPYEALFPLRAGRQQAAAHGLLDEVVRFDIAIEEMDSER